MRCSDMQKAISRPPSSMCRYPTVLDFRPTARHSIYPTMDRTCMSVPTMWVPKARCPTNATSSDILGRKAPDGLKVDSAGNVWTTGPGGIRIIAPNGKVLGQIKLPEVASNIAFAAKDRRTVYVTASHSIYRLFSIIPGQKLLYFR